MLSILFSSRVFLRAKLAPDRGWPTGGRLPNGWRSSIASFMTIPSCAVAGGSILISARTGAAVNRARAMRETMRALCRSSRARINNSNYSREKRPVSLPVSLLACPLYPTTNSSTTLYPSLVTADISSPFLFSGRLSRAGIDGRAEIRGDSSFSAYLLKLQTFLAVLERGFPSCLRLLPYLRRMFISPRNARLLLSDF